MKRGNTSLWLEIHSVCLRQTVVRLGDFNIMSTVGRPLSSLFRLFRTHFYNMNVALIQTSWHIAQRLTQHTKWKLMKLGEQQFLVNCKYLWMNIAQSWHSKGKPKMLQMEGDERQRQINAIVTSHQNRFKFIKSTIFPGSAWKRILRPISAKIYLYICESYFVALKYAYIALKWIL